MPSCNSIEQSFRDIQGLGGDGITTAVNVFRWESLNEVRLLKLGNSLSKENFQELASWNRDTWDPLDIYVMAMPYRKDWYDVQQGLFL